MLCSPREAGENSKENMERPGPVAACLERAAAPGPGPPELPPPKLRYGRITHPGTKKTAKTAIFIATHPCRVGLLDYFHKEAYLLGSQKQDVRLSNITLTDILSVCYTINTPTT